MGKQTSSAGNIDCTYLCPLRLPGIDANLIAEFEKYWQYLSLSGCEILVVDGSDADIHKVLLEEWKNCRIIPADHSYGYLNGKVNGVFTGIRESTYDRIILADDDIRFNIKDIHRILKELEDFEMVRPQNYFLPNPWWTKIDSARILINRAAFPEGDFPGCFALRKKAFTEAGSFDGDVLFDNEELVKHFVNKGRKINYSRNFFIRRNPPNFSKWLEQRPRQAYEDFIMRIRSFFFFSLLPLLISLLFFKAWMIAATFIVSVFLSAMVLAWAGRRGDAAGYFPLSIIFYAPLWFLERSISIYIALYWRLFKGGYPFGNKIIKKGTGDSWKAALRKMKKSGLS